MPPCCPINAHDAAKLTDCVKDIKATAAVMHVVLVRYMCTSHRSFTAHRNTKQHRAQLREMKSETLKLKETELNPGWPPCHVYQEDVEPGLDHLQETRTCDERGAYAHDDKQRTRNDTHSSQVWKLHRRRGDPNGDRGHEQRHQLCWIWLRIQKQL